VSARRGDATGAAAQYAALADLPKDVHWDDPYLDAVQKRQVGLFQRLDRAQALHARRLHAEAEELVHGILKDHPKSDEAYFLLARIYLTIGDAARSEAAALQGVAIAPKAASGHFQVGSARLIGGDVAGAERAFRTAVELQPDYAVAHYGVGECRRRRDDPRGAAAAYREALRYRPNMVEAHVALGAALLEAGDAAAARTHLADALRLRPDDPEATKLLKKAGGP
jgi:tetratricopeptide (TPR) repeat protein